MTSDIRAKLRRAVFAGFLTLVSGATSGHAAEDKARLPGRAGYDWSGFYIGGHVGGGWSRTRATADPLPSVAVFGVLPNALGIGGEGVVGGIQGGYNWQLAPRWVGGIEVDFSGTGISGRSTVAMVPGPGVSCAVNCFVHMNRNVDYLGTVRGRFGYSWDRWLAYASGGYAYGGLAFPATATTFLTRTYPAATIRTTKSGWTVGGGVERALSGDWGRWAVRGEYLYYQFGGVSAVGAAVPASPPFGYRYTWNETQIHSVRFAISYRFGGAADH